MPWRAFLLLLCCLPPLALPAKEPTAAELGKCPHGHDTLRDVPILYGLPPSLGAEAKQLRRDVADGKVALGGCEVSEDSPRQLTKCTTCGATFRGDSLSKTGSGRWSIIVDHPEQLPRPLPSPVNTFPLPAASNLRKPAQYTQTLNEKLEVKSNSLSYSSRQPAVELEKSIKGWSKASDIKLSPSTQSTPDALAWENRSREIMIWLTSARDGASVSASFGPP